jgi:hypothetical protein
MGSARPAARSERCQRAGHPPEEAAIRLALEGDALISKLDKPRPGDAMYDHDGRKVLVMDERVSQLLDGSTLELQPTAEGEKLVLIQ